MSKKILWLPLLIMALYSLSGCGQKGPLYLPPPEQHTHDNTDTHAK